MRSHFQHLLSRLGRLPDVQLDPRTVHVAEQLKAVPWFAQVGQPFISGEPVLLLASWQDAVEHATSPIYDDFVLEAANELRGNVCRQSRRQFQTWNAVVSAIKSFSEPMVGDKIAAAELPHAIATAISGTVHWDMVHIFLALHFQENYHSDYYESLLGWYLGGRFPCGWRGKYPEGQFIIY